MRFISFIGIEMQIKTTLSYHGFVTLAKTDRLKNTLFRAGYGGKAG